MKVSTEAERVAEQAIREGQISAGGAVILELAAYERGRREAFTRAAEIADDFATLHVDVIAYAAARIAAAIRAEITRTEAGGT